MISYIRGTAVYADNENVIIENQGMGYQVRTTSGVCDQIRQGQELTMYTYLYVREDLLALYGFLTREELRLFEILLGINGIGPKVAVAVLSTLSVEDLYYAVISDDTKSISRTPGIGPKGAQRMIMELKDKLELSDLGISAGDGEGLKGAAFPQNGGEGENTLADAMDALIALGYSNGDAYRAVHKVPDAARLDTETLLKEALKVMMTL